MSQAPTPPRLFDDELHEAMQQLFDETIEAIQLAKVRPRGEAASVARRVVRERLARDLRLPADAADDELRAAAVARGWEPASVEAALGGDLLELGRALERLEREEAIV